MLEALLRLVDPALSGRSGSVFYSGRSAFSARNDLYLLGLNPGGSPTELATNTIERHIQEAIEGRADWSAYKDESWQGKPPGTYGMQPRVLHLLRQLGHDPQKTPASNVVFVRTRREADLNREKADLLKACWPVHQAVIEQLGVRAVICFGGTAGAWARQKLAAHEEVGQFIEDNRRRWTSKAHRNPGGLCVVTLTHPSIAKWDTPATDPTPFGAAHAGGLMATMEADPPNCGTGSRLCKNADDRFFAARTCRQAANCHPSAQGSRTTESLRDIIFRALSPRPSFYTASVESEP